MSVATHCIPWDEGCDRCNPPNGAPNPGGDAAPRQEAVPAGLPTLEQVRLCLVRLSRCSSKRDAERELLTALNHVATLYATARLAVEAQQERERLLTALERALHGINSCDGRCFRVRKEVEDAIDATRTTGGTE